MERLLDLSSEALVWDDKSWESLLEELSKTTYDLDSNNVLTNETSRKNSTHKRKKRKSSVSASSPVIPQKKIIPKDGINSESQLNLAAFSFDDKILSNYFSNVSEIKPSIDSAHLNQNIVKSDFNPKPIKSKEKTEKVFTSIPETTSKRWNLIESKTLLKQVKKLYQQGFNITYNPILKNKKPIFDRDWENVSLELKKLGSLKTGAMCNKRWSTIYKYLGQKIMDFIQDEDSKIIPSPPRISKIKNPPTTQAISHMGENTQTKKDIAKNSILKDKDSKIKQNNPNPEINGEKIPEKKPFDHKKEPISEPFNNQDMPIGKVSFENFEKFFLGDDRFKSKFYCQLVSDVVEAIENPFSRAGMMVKKAKWQKEIEIENSRSSNGNVSKKQTSTLNNANSIVLHKTGPHNNSLFNFKTNKSDFIEGDSVVSNTSNYLSGYKDVSSIEFNPGASNDSFNSSVERISLLPIKKKITQEDQINDFFANPEIKPVVKVSGHSDHKKSDFDANSIDFNYYLEFINSLLPQNFDENKNPNKKSKKNQKLNSKELIKNSDFQDLAWKSDSLELLHTTSLNNFHYNKSKKEHLPATISQTDVYDDVVDDDYVCDKSDEDDDDDDDDDKSSENSAHDESNSEKSTNNFNSHGDLFQNENIGFPNPLINHLGSNFDKIHQENKDFQTYFNNKPETYPYNNSEFSLNSFEGINNSILASKPFNGENNNNNLNLAGFPTKNLFDPTSVVSSDFSSSSLQKGESSGKISDFNESNQVLNHRTKQSLLKGAQINESSLFQTDNQITYLDLQNVLSLQTDSNLKNSKKSSHPETGSSTNTYYDIRRASGLNGNKKFLNLTNTNLPKQKPHSNKIFPINIEKDSLRGNALSDGEYSKIQNHSSLLKLSNSSNNNLYPGNSSFWGDSQSNLYMCDTSIPESDAMEVDAEIESLFQEAILAGEEIKFENQPLLLDDFQYILNENQMETLRRQNQDNLQLVIQAYLIECFQHSPHSSTAQNWKAQLLDIHNSINHGLSKTFGRNEKLRNLSFSYSPGSEILVPVVLYLISDIHCTFQINQHKPSKSKWISHEKLKDNSVFGETKLEKGGKVFNSSKGLLDHFKTKKKLSGSFNKEHNLEPKDEVAHHDVSSYISSPSSNQDYFRKNLEEFYSKQEKNRIPSSIPSTPVLSYDDAFDPSKLLESDLVKKATCYKICNCTAQQMPTHPFLLEDVLPSIHKRFVNKSGYVFRAPNGDLVNYLNSETNSVCAIISEQLTEFVGKSKKLHNFKKRNHSATNNTFGHKVSKEATKGGSTQQGKDKEGIVAGKDSGIINFTANNASYIVSNNQYTGLEACPIPTDPNNEKIQKQSIVLGTGRLTDSSIFISVWI
ncbi:hypothetical protein AYI68_g885 [Smittium mucronatum]|uniref:Myb-like domain-containing protein n=1 Tax=Smittium mucronatum TaxID=133383 RepID=A0A1R0H790_9FUNG|nr:hypothetical protein AYI68_g885 [Smittium mucronatum]